MHPLAFLLVWPGSSLALLASLLLLAVSNMVSYYNAVIAIS
jgi:hypothetical protein